MNSAGLSLVLVVIFITDDAAFSLILPRKKVSFECSAWKNEYFASCYFVECEPTCENQRGTCPRGFHMSSDYCRPGCTCAPGYVRDKDRICTVASVSCKFQDLAASFSRDPFWSGPFASGTKKNRRRRLRYAT